MTKRELEKLLQKANFEKKAGGKHDEILLLCTFQKNA